MKNNVPILLIDDDVEILKIYKKIFEMNGFNIVTEIDSIKAIELIESKDFAVVLTDIIMPKLDGNDILRFIKANKPEIEVIMLTAEGSVDGAVEAVKQGAYNYLVKPVDIENMMQAVKSAYYLWNIKKENSNLKEIISEKDNSNVFVGSSKEMIKIKNNISKIAPTNASVLILGESGTGKEVLAKLIHNNSLRKDKPMISVNCAGLSSTLIESELFGHEKGSFTGADKQKKGKFELADGGTLFLDEVGEMPLEMQAKLLRAIQEKKFERVGGNEVVYTDFRLISATNISLIDAVKNGDFREDLYYRLNVIQIEMPSLYERQEDIVDMFYFFVNMYSKELNKEISNIDKEIIEAIKAYTWPGNIRELKNAVERLIVLSDEGNLRMETLPSVMNYRKLYIDKEEIPISFDTNLKQAVKRFEEIYIQKILDNNNGNMSHTAKQLGIARNNLYNKIKELNVLRNSNTK